MKVSIVGRPVSIPVKQETIDSFFTFILLELEFRTFTYTHCAPITLWLVGLIIDTNFAAKAKRDSYSNLYLHRKAVPRELVYLVFCKM